MNYTKEELLGLIREVMGIKSITPMITKQINRFVVQDNMTYKDIARCIVWYTEVKGMTFDPVFGIAMVANIREQAENYFKQLELDQQNKAAEAKKVVEYQGNNIIFNIKSLKHEKRKPKQLDIGDINVEGDNK